MREGRKNLRYPANTALAERDTSCPLVSTSKTLDTIAAGRLAPSGDRLRLCFLLGFQTCITAVAHSCLVSALAGLLLLN